MGSCSNSFTGFYSANRKNPCHWQKTGTGAGSPMAVPCVVFDDMELESLAEAVMSREREAAGIRREAAEADERSNEAFPPLEGRREAA